jgi:TNF receptor-associated factor 2
LAKQLSKKEIDNKKIEQITAHLHEYYEILSTSTESIEKQHDEILRLDSDLFLLNNQQLTLVEDIDNTKVESLLQKDYIEAISNNQNVLTQDCTSLRQQTEHENPGTKHHILDGTMIWKICNVREKMYDSQSERQTSIYSPPFYTSEAGYKLCIRLYLNGDGTARGTHISIFLVILRGKFDSLLKWPFSYRVSFCLFDQRSMIESNGTQPAKHIIESFRPDINSVSFQRPRSQMNIASGIPKFLPLGDLNQPEEINRYIINDTMFIKILIDFIGISKSILPFIFNLNIGLPLQIQQKLIDEEIERRNEQNNS